MAAASCLHVTITFWEGVTLALTCHSSVFEGGIRVPGFIAWPGLMGPTHMGHTSYVASSLDFMATVNDILGLEYPKPGWKVDSKSLLPLLDGRVPLAHAARQKPIGWQYGTQRALTNQSANGETWKLVERGAKGQCATMLPPYRSGKGVYLFNLDSDETESHDLCLSNPTQCSAMKALMAEYMAGVESSAVNESGCDAGAPTPPVPTPPVPPSPPPPCVAVDGFQCHENTCADVTGHRGKGHGKWHCGKELCWPKVTSTTLCAPLPRETAVVQAAARCSADPVCHSFAMNSAWSSVRPRDCAGNASHTCAKFFAAHSTAQIFSASGWSLWLQSAV